MHHPTSASISNAVALSLWNDTRGERITRESAARVAEHWQVQRASMPASTSPDWQEGWDMACETIALALRFRA